MEEALCRAAGILEQVFTRAGCTRYLHTFGSSGTEPIVHTSIHGVVPRARERYEKKGERLKIHRSGTSFSLEMLILVRRSIESLGESVIEVPLNFFAEREFGYNEYLAIPQIEMYEYTVQYKVNTSLHILILSHDVITFLESKISRRRVQMYFFVRCKTQ